MAPRLPRLPKVVSRPIGTVTRLANTPMGNAGSYRPVYGTHLLDRVINGPRSLEDAVADKVILITGASSGIGLATAEKIGAARGTVILVARGREKLEEAQAAVEAVGGTAHVHPTDLSDLEAIDQLADDVIAAYGRVDVLVNNAGRSIRRSVALSYDRFHDFERTMQLNYFAPLRLILKLLPGMRERKSGHVINVSSIGVQTRVPRFGAYIASKSALDTLSDAIQAEAHDDNVRFTTVHMPLVRTPMIAPTTLYDKFPTLTPEQAADVLANAIVYRPRRLGSPIGQVAAFADALNPQVMDAVRNRGYHLFPDSKAAKGKPDPQHSDAEIGRAGETFARMTRGIHW
ncbi:SDR family NAD(P)-dependent oxidoreductase [Patulibacter defluvii]|uniref:SDR family NAD(P)-dependent oxidoreductase n=1 Tax=Patulibacter defluvii TaxID=3095358 RepID=UPI002A765DB5|nr:SDR family NAD(P)-dependent oxidoreductase [Patulibacter sp. DM4]